MMLKYVRNDARGGGGGGGGGGGRNKAFVCPLCLECAPTKEIPHVKCNVVSLALLTNTSGLY